MASKAQGLWDMLLLAMVAAAAKGAELEEALKRAGMGAVTSAAQAVALAGALTGRIPDISAEVPEDIEALYGKYGIEKMALYLSIFVIRDGLSPEGKDTLNSSQFKAVARTELGVVKETLQSWPLR